MLILGLNAYHGDAAAAIIRDGELIAAVEEERFNRRKHCAGFPAESIKYCLSAAGASIEEVAHVGISRDPSAHLHKKILFAAQRAAKSLGNIGTERAPSNKAGPGLIRQVTDRLSNAAKVRDLKDELAKALSVPKKSLHARVHNIEHHRAHLASSFYVSPFERAALLSIDGFGDFISTMWGEGHGNSIEVLGQVEYPHSAGIVYTATTQFLGFPHYGDEGKVMGLAPYGSPRFMEEFRDIIRTDEGGRFRLNLDYFRHHAEGVEMSWETGSPVIGRIFSDEYVKRFGPARAAGAPLTDRERDIAASLQQRLEEVAFHTLNHLHEKTGLTDLGLSGGVAYNSVMNGKILLKTPFRRVFVQPAAGDSGTAIGVCYQIHNSLLKQPRGFVMEGAYTGPEFSDASIRRELGNRSLKYETYSDRELTERAARDIADGLVTGWFQGRMEFGPRALGNRSIVVDPRRAEMKEILNERIKKREPFRPFAPSILEEHVADYFEQTHPAPTMLMVYQIRQERRDTVPAVTHVDGSGRLQTVSRDVNERYHQLISDFYKLTRVPLVLNTSFNENEPIVCTPAHAIECFMKTRMDVLYLGNYAVRRYNESVPPAVAGG
ncbi:MAG TPA: carbamoyltransferase C-terminal domain-containing protein [Pyrinomonadaceae bacterium]